METSYKEKYEKALEKIKNLIDKDHNDINVDDILNVFPELAESEDEKVIKEIIELVMQPIWKTEEEFHRRNVLCAWLKNIPVTIDHEKREGFHLGYKARLEKQGEQKPEENKGNIGGISANWSEEDKDFMYDTLSNLTELKDRYGEGYGNVGKCIDWVKSLKGRVGCKANCTTTKEWSEDDERHKNTIIRAIHGAGNITPIDGELAEDWLKSLRPQSRWKPSEGDIIILEKVFKGELEPKVFQATLQGILEQLKKL